ncbi:MAG: hypothetical protein IJT53_05870, partial [Prevotella sp.]|nr:hypothetical protein [Prevotella sp.]
MTNLFSGRKIQTPPLPLPFLRPAGSKRPQAVERRGGECHAACPSPSCVPLVASARKRSSGGEGSAMRPAP